MIVEPPDARALREALSLNALLLSSNRDCVLVLDPDGTIRSLSPGGVQAMEIADPAALVGASWLRVWRGVAPAVAEAAIAEARGGGTGRFQGFCATERGTPKWWEVVISPLPGPDGAPHRLACVGRDVTDFARSSIRRLALVELGDRLRGLDDPADMAFVAGEIMGRTLQVSRAGYGTVDPARETITIERDWTAPGIASLAGTLRFRDFGSYIEDLKRGETVIFADARADPRTAATAAALEAISARAVINLPIFEHDSFVALIFLNHAETRAWSFQEIDFIRNAADRIRTAIERRRAEDRLRAAAASLERQVAERTADRTRLWQLSTDIMLVATFSGDIAAVNPAWTGRLGWREDELVGRNLLDLVHPEDREETRRAAQAMSTGQSLHRFESRYRHKDGSYRWITWGATPGDGFINAVGRDITTEKDQAAALALAEERLRQSQKMEAVGQLTGGLAHDFNNLLTGIGGSLELLQTRVAQGRIGELDRYINAAQAAARRAAALTHRLLAFSRRQTLDPRPTELNRLVAGMDDLLRRTVGPAVTVEVVAAGGLWNTLIDPNQLENALLNLCINARDAMPEGGRLTIETANRWLDERSARERDLTPGQYVSLSVSDTGTGMTPDVIARAFDPFFTTKPIGQGTGLGLSMTYGFARQSGGQVRIYSEIGQGTMVCLYLPRHLGKPAEDDPPMPAPASLPHAGHGETVLVVDDEAAIRMLVADVLNDLGYDTVEAADGAAGLEVLRSDRRLDLLITDVGLPGGMNGRQVADAGRVVRPNLKVLFITGYAENAVIGNGHLEPGMQVLTKPFAMDVLASRIKAMIAGG